MYPNSPVNKNLDGSTYSGEKDPRVTQIRKIIRKTSIDEFPQIKNVLKGDISLVVPRPVSEGDPEEQAEFKKNQKNHGRNQNRSFHLSLGRRRSNVLQTIYSDKERGFERKTA